MPPPQNARLKKRTRQLIAKRRYWRKRALEAAVAMATWRTGEPGRDKVETQTMRSLSKVRDWFRSPRDTLVINAIQRRAIRAFRQQ